MAIDEELMRLRDEVIGLRARLDEANYRLAAAAADSLDQRRALEIERAAHEAVVIELKHVQRERNAVLDARDEIGRLRFQIDELHRSRTWRLGRFLLLPIRALRKVRGLLRRA